MNLGAALRGWSGKERVPGPRPSSSRRNPRKMAMSRSQPSSVARTWLREILANGPRPAREVRREAAAHGIGYTSLTAARKAEGVTAHKERRRPWPVGLDPRRHQQQRVCSHRRANSLNPLRPFKPFNPSIAPGRPSSDPRDTPLTSPIPTRSIDDLQKTPATPSAPLTVCHQGVPRACQPAAVWRNSRGGQRPWSSSCRSHSQPNRMRLRSRRSGRSYWGRAHAG